MKKAKYSKTEDDWKLAKTYRNECVAATRRAKSDFVTAELEKNKNDSKKLKKKHS